MKKTWIVILGVAAVLFCSFKAAESVFFVKPKGWPEPVYDLEQNKLTKEKVALGRKLFFDPILSLDNTISCASCHLPQTAFTHIDHDLSHGIGGKIGIRNSPALMNLAWFPSFMWDGAVHHLDVQALAPITNPDEMGETVEHVVQKLQEQPQYKALFKDAFGDTVVTGTHTLKALSQYMLTLVSADAKYDKVMRKEPGAVFNEYEAKGYVLFQQNCAACHKEPLFTNNAFENNGLPVDTTLNDAGRMNITGNDADRGKFKVPTLRNIEVTYPYMHDGRFKSLQMVLFHYTEGVHDSPTLSARLKKPVKLTEDDKRNLIQFLKTLTDEEFLHNEQYQPNQF